jgi:putative transposase
MRVMSYRKGSHSVYDIKYHIVWITKFRKPILRGEVAKHLRELVRQTCATLDISIVSGHVAVDHVHLLVSVPPQLAVSELVQRLKGRTSRRLLEDFDELKRQFWGRHIWARGYFVASSGNVTDEVIKQYIEAQEKNLPPDDNSNFTLGDSGLTLGDFSRTPKLPTSVGSR